MGYETSFVGEFTISPGLQSVHAAYLSMFSTTRRMKRDPHKTEQLADELRHTVGLPIGEDGGYYVGNTEGKDVIDYNSPPSGQPGLWCPWYVTPHDTIECPGRGKHYSYVEWMDYLLKHFFTPWGYSVTGFVEWEGEDRDDRGRLHVINGMTFVQQPEIRWVPEISAINLLIAATEKNKG